MAKYLVIVESPTKVRTIKKFLGNNYEIAASQGHVRDLPKSSLGIDVDGDYDPTYITIRGKGDILSELRKDVKKADKVFLATDPDREGEAISWHLAAALKLEDKDIHRITFNEITKTAVKAALASPRKIDMNLVNAQQTRRMLDRMVGYMISPLLWKKVKKGLSAGRVQSAVLNMICEREAEIASFVPEEYWTLEAEFLEEGLKKSFAAKYCGTDSAKVSSASKEEMTAISEALKNADFKVVSVKEGERVKKAPLPFTTSTMQQEATKKLNFATFKTMKVAQQLYEGVEIKGRGATGLITYLRTDSTRVADEAAEAAKKEGDTSSGKSPDEKKIKEKEEKEIKDDYSNYYTNKKGNEKKQCSMDENIFIQYFFN
ncbi:MAG: type I DNA topoisomerase, partial [Lachnospiraceae bacterium]|nr:type I DNA topoisomerase [Lachnospiraceae bacterium]